MNTENTTAVIYARVSSQNERRQDTSRQIADLKRFATAQNMKILNTFEEELTGKITYELKPNINGNKKDDNQLLEHTK